MKTPEQIAAETAEKISANLCAPSDYPLPPSSVKDRCRPFILAALTEHAKGLEEKAHGFKLCFPYETIGNMNPALFKDGSYHYYVPEAERDQLRAEVERLQKAGTSWEAIELRAEVEHLKKEVQENQLQFPCRMTKEAYLSDAKTRQDLRARVAELELQTFDIKKLEVDKARLDWLEEMHAGCNHGPSDKPTMFHCWVEVSGRHENPADHFYGNTLRAAIDAAKGGAQ